MKFNQVHFIELLSQLSFTLLFIEFVGVIH